MSRSAPQNDGLDPDPGRWESTTDASRLAQWLGGARRVVVLTHVKPDGDAVGSTLALTRTLNYPNREVATCWYFGPLPDWLPDVARHTPRRLITEADRAEHDPGPEPDAIVILDTGTWSQLHEVREWLMSRRAHCAVIDHHRQGDADVAPRRWLTFDAAAVCQPVAELCRLLLHLDSCARLPVAIAEPLYLGLATDTGWFRHSNVTAAALRLGADLLDAGVQHSALYELVEQRDPPARLRLMGRALASLELHAQDTVALMTLRQADFRECRARPMDSSGLVDTGLQIQSVHVSCLLTEVFSDGSGTMTKVSLRSKDRPGSPDVSAIARRFGGGGHVRAAGAKVNGDLATVRRLVLDALTT